MAFIRDPRYGTFYTGHPSGHPLRFPGLVPNYADAYVNPHTTPYYPAPIDPRFFSRPDFAHLAGAFAFDPSASGIADHSVPQNGKHVLVTGGAGYIGSHTVLELVEAGFGVVVIDNLCNASEESLRRVGELTGKPEAVKFFNVDVCDLASLEAALARCPPFYACIHFAALKAVGESTKKPLLYYQNNVAGTLALLEALDKHGCRTLVFSSSATVYGSAPIPYTESSQVGVGITNAYGRTKYMIEEILRDMSALKENEWKIILLRYFNPVGAHPSGQIGEDPSGIPNNLMPYISQVCVGRREHLTVFGKDYKTVDGTGMRDYIHVVDLAKGHVAALSKVETPGAFCEVFNLGSGEATSVLQLVHAMEKVCGKQIPVVFGERRAGDLPAFWANSDKAFKELGWKTHKTVNDMCADTWRWQSNNPQGYGNKK